MAAALLYLILLLKLQLGELQQFTVYYQYILDILVKQFVAIKAPCRLRGCKNRPTPFPGRMSYKATKPGLVCVYILACFNCIVAY